MMRARPFDLIAAALEEEDQPGEDPDRPLDVVPVEARPGHRQCLPVGKRVLVIVPKPAAPATAEGCPRFAWLKRSNASARN